MNRFDTRVLLAFFAVAGILIIGAFAALAIEVKGDADTAQACIEAGKEWVHVRGAIYECRAL